MLSEEEITSLLAQKEKLTIRLSELNPLGLVTQSLDNSIDDDSRNQTETNQSTHWDCVLKESVSLKLIHCFKLMKKHISSLISSNIQLLTW
jgi:hypothetical protein